MKKKIALIVIFILSFVSIARAQIQPSVVIEALTHLNKPYVYATAGPASFDCSGFVFYCFKVAEDIELERSAKDQGYDETYEKITSIEHLLPGDLVFFNTNHMDNDLSDHSGLYIGNKQFIHCSSAKGMVIISSLEDGYYVDNFSWGRRVIGRNVYEYNDKER